MKWLFGIAVVVIAFFIWQGFRTRCPACGKSALHPKDAKAEAEKQRQYEMMKSSGLLDGLDRAGCSVGTDRAKPGYTNRNLRCKKCNHSFDRRTAITWLTTANKLGDDVALDEYRKLQIENDDE